MPCFALATAKAAALQSVVMLKNDDDALPLSRTRLDSIAVIGPLADAPYEQLGTWVFDGDPGLSVTALQGIRDLEARESVQVDFAAIPGSRVGELSARFDIVMGFTPTA